MPEPNYTNSQDNRGWLPPGGWGGQGPTQKCTVMLKVSPRAQGMGQEEVSGVGGRRETGQQASGDVPSEGIAGEWGWGSSWRPRPKLVGSGIDGGRKAAAPSPSCLPSVAKVSAGKGRRELRDRRQARLAGGGGHKGRGPWVGEGRYANGRIDPIPRPLIKAPAAAAAAAIGRSRVAGWLALLTGGRGGSRAPQTKGTLAPLHPGTATVGNTDGRPEPQPPKSSGGNHRGPRVGGTPTSTPSRTLRLCPCFSESSCPAWTPQTPSSPIHKLLPRLVFQGSGGRQKGPRLRMRTPADGDGGNRGIPAEPEKGKGGTTPQMEALGWFVRLGDEDPRG